MEKVNLKDPEEVLTDQENTDDWDNYVGDNINF